MLVRVSKPPYTWNGRTIFGVGDDETERGVQLLGERYDIDEGEEFIVTGTVRLIRHPAHLMNGVVVEWEELRLEE